MIAGADESAETLKSIAGSLRDAHDAGLGEEMLIAVARRALRGEWRPAERSALAEVLRDHQQFGYARRLLSRVRAGGDSERLRQQHALCTYKDLELPARRRLDRALEILMEGPPSDRTAETFGIAGAILKRLWEVDARQGDLEAALAFYRRGFEHEDDADRWYAGVNAAFVSDQLADLEQHDGDRAQWLKADAERIRKQIVAELSGGDGGWGDATLGEAYFGLGDFGRAKDALGAVGAKTKELWRQETTAMQLATLARLHGVADDPAAIGALTALVGGRAGAVQRAFVGKVGIALSGGGYRSSLFHIGVLARLAECRVLRHVEVLSCVSGGSILGAYYYLALRRLLEKHAGRRHQRQGLRRSRPRSGSGLSRRRPQGPSRPAVHEPRRQREDARHRLLTHRSRQRVCSKSTSTTGCECRSCSSCRPANAAGFTLRHQNWLRKAKVPILVLNATTLNTGHNWQFTPTWMGEPPFATDERVDASQRLRRVYYRDAPDQDALRRPRLATAVAASACVPGLFAPIRLRRLYDDVDVELVDGGVHDNQGVASLVEQDCSVILVSDASGQLRDTDDPKRFLLRVLKRSNDILMKRVRATQYAELANRHAPARCAAS